jgi:cytochrome o ubiquinol oxidase subunit II
MTKHDKVKKQPSRRSVAQPVVLIVFGLALLAFCIAYIMQGTNVALLDVKGTIASEQRKLILFAAGLLLSVALPTVLFLYFIAWKYRESNTKAVYHPHTRQGKGLVATIWGLPTVIMIILALVMWPATHRLEPRKTIAADAKPMTIQVISMRWKWVFIYPEQEIATVNFVNIPVGTPVTFELTADEAPMSSFWIPNLGGQLYSMTGHVNQLNLIADTAGDYPGSSAEINGPGFAGMKFTARASTDKDFDAWVQRVKQSKDVLDKATYDELVKPSENNPAVFYSAYDSSLYDKVIEKYMGGHSHTPTYEKKH